MKPEFLPYSSKLNLFNELNQSDWDHLHLKVFAPKQVIIEEGSFSHMNLYLILSGVCVAIKKRHEDDSYFAPYKICAGEFTGLRELLGDTPSKRPITILAKTEVTALEIQGEAFLSWRIKYGTTYNAIIQAVLCQQFSSRRLMVNCILKDSLSAGAYYFCILYKIYHDSCYPPNYAKDVKIWDTRSEIAVAIGRNIRSVDRIINIFQNRDYLSVQRGKIYMNQEQYNKMQDFLN